jgi:hypothetical protein
MVLDRWTFRLPINALRKRPGIDKRHARQNLCVVVLVMVVSATTTIVTGAVAGFVLSCLIFIINMTRPIVRRRYSGDEIFSKCTRSNSDMELLLRSAGDRVVLELQGVLFFGNAAEFAHLVGEVLKESTMVLLDLHGISGDHRVALTAGYHAAFFVGAIIAAIAAALSYWLLRERGRAVAEAAE